MSLIYFGSTLSALKHDGLIEGCISEKKELAVK